MYDSFHVWVCNALALTMPGDGKVKATVLMNGLSECGFSNCALRTHSWMPLKANLRKEGR